jgi:hypothetical protein
MLVLHLLAAAVLLTLALYAQHRIPFHTAGRRKVLLTRGVLAVVGMMLGFVWASLASDPALRLLAFVEGFGAVHFPAALILFFKRARHEGRS